MINKVQKEHKADFDGFHIQFDNYYTTHSPENKYFSELIFSRLKDKGSIVKRDVEQAYCEKCKMSLPDRFVRGVCPKCKRRTSTVTHAKYAARHIGRPTL